jgi:hypothetical protein
VAWLATAYVPGPSLDEAVHGHGPLPEGSLLALAAGLAESLTAIHAAGVVHQDLKPSNVLLAEDGPRVIDFGISRAADGTALTAAGVVFGTPGFMSPEQAEGQSAGPASDVFALGCVVAYAATGAGPFGTGTAAAILYRVVYSEPVLDGIPPQLREMIAACLAKDPAARPTLRALSGATSSGRDATGPSAVAFWPSSVAGLIGAYQARLEQETRGGSRPAEAEGFSWVSRSTSAHPPTTPSDPGNNRPQQPPGPGPGAGTRWPYPEPLSQAGPGSPGGFAAQGNGVPQANVGVQAQAMPGSQGHPESQGYPRSQGYSQPQGYPQPQGYRDGQASQPPYAPPRGYLPAHGGPASPGPPPSAGYPPPYQMGSRGPIAPLPASMATAVRLMYAGAAYALVWTIGVIVVWANIVKNHPVISGGSDHRLAGVVTLSVLLSVVDIALWLGIARACRRGRSGARVAGTVLFAIHTIGVLGVLASSEAGLDPAKVLTLIGWLIGCGAVAFLWQRPSSAFFAARRH